jgi:hypothetical protein
MKSGQVSQLRQSLLLKVFRHWIVSLDHFDVQGKQLMRTPAKLFLPIMIVCVWLPSFTARAQSGDPAVIDKFIASQARKEEGSEPDGIRKVITGDLNRDGVPDAAVLFTIEGQNGTNNYVQYLAVFLRKNGRLVYAAHKQVGGKNMRSIELTSIKDNLMFCDTTDYAKRDPSCCPTIKGRTSYALVRNKLTEMRRK